MLNGRVRLSSTPLGSTTVMVSWCGSIPPSGDVIVVSPHRFQSERNRTPTEDPQQCSPQQMSATRRTGRHVSVDHHHASRVRVQAQPLLVLHLEQFQQLNLLSRRTDHASRPIRIREQDPGSGRPEQLDTTGRQTGQHIDHIEIADQSVDKFDERGRGQGLAGQAPSLRYVRLVLSADRSARWTCHVSATAPWGEGDFCGARSLLVSFSTPHISQLPVETPSPPWPLPSSSSSSSSPIDGRYSHRSWRPTHERCARSVSAERTRNRASPNAAGRPRQTPQRR